MKLLIRCFSIDVVFCMLCLFSFTGTRVLAAAPPNDDFANRITLSGLSASATISSLEQAVTEGGEPLTNSSYPYSVWYEWTAPDDGIVRIDATNSQYPHAIDVFFGNTLGSLNPVAADTGSTSAFAFQEIPITQGSVLVFRYRGGNTYPYTSPGETGYLYVNLRTNTSYNGIALARPSTINNDLFANRIAITGSITAIGYQKFATREGGEPTTTGDYTAWWEWTAPSAGTASFQSLVVTRFGLDGSDRDTISVWSGTQLASLTLIGSRTPTGSTPISTTVTAGQKIQIAMANTTYPGPNASVLSVSFTGSPVPAQMLSPASGTTLASSSATFAWSSGTGVTSYALWIGSAPGGYDVYSGNEGVNLSKTVTTLPTDGRPLYVTLHSLINGTYQSNAYTYTAFRAPGPVKAQITSPVNGSTLGSTTLPLVWNAGTSVTSYYLFVGTTPGGYDLYAGDQGTALSRSVNVPAGGGKVHVTLWSLIKGAYQSNKYVFTTVASDKAALTGPTNGSTLAGNSLNLSWTAGTGVSRYYVYIGSSYGGYDIAAVDAGTSNAWNFTVPQDGGPVYVTIWSLVNGGFQANNYWFTTALPPSGNRPARITSPANASTLGSATMNLAWDAGSGASSYALWVGSTPDGYDLYSGLEGSSLSKSIPIPGDGRRIYVTLHSLIGGAYQSNSYFFTAPTLPDGGAAQVTSPANGSTLANSSLTLTWGAAAGATQYYLFAGSMPGASDLYSGNQGTNFTYTLNGMPIDGRAIYVTLYSLINGVYKQSSAYYKTSNTASGNRRALITSPANGTSLPGAANTFTWGGGSGVTSYALWIGSSPGAYDLWSSAETLATTSRSVTLPTDGRKIHVTLYSFISGAWQGASYIYTAANVAPTKAAMTSPVNGTTFTSASQTFTWSASNSATMYALWIGRSPGAYDIYAGAEGTNTSRTVTTLPTDGSPVYVTLYSLINGTWQGNEYIYQAALVP